MMEEWKLSRLRPDPRNAELFDDVTGLEFDALVASIQDIGLINPLTVTPTGLIICGHQRYRALRRAGVTRVPVTIRAVADDDEDAKEKVRIEEQMRRRTLSPAEQVRVVQAWYRVYGVGQGARSSLAREKLADRYGIQPQAQTMLAKIATLIPPILNQFEEGTLSRAAAYTLAQMSKQEQEAIVAALGEADVGLATQQEAKRWQALLEEEQARRAIAEADRDALRLVLESEPEDAGDAAEREAEVESLRQRLAAVSEQLDSREESLASMTQQVQALESQVAEAERLTRFADNNKVHAWLKQSRVLPGTDPAEFADALMSDPAIADFVGWHRQWAIDAYTWLGRYIQCLNGVAPVAKGGAIRRLP